VGSFKAAGVLGLARDVPGPKGPSKLTEALTARIIELQASGLTLMQVAAQTGVSTATVRVALGRVTPRTIGPAARPVEPENPAQNPV